MVGSGASSDRSKEAVGMMALHDALRYICLNTDWIYSVFWTIHPHLRVRRGNGCNFGDDHGSLMSMWEDGFCRGRTWECLDEINSEEAVRKAFSKMSIQLYNYIIMEKVRRVGTWLISHSKRYWKLIWSASSYAAWRLARPCNF